MASNMPTDELAAIIDEINRGLKQLDDRPYSLDARLAYLQGKARHIPLLVKALTAHRQQVAALASDCRLTASVLSDPAIADVWLRIADRLESLGAKP